MILDIEQDLLDGVLIGGGRCAPLAASVGIERKEKTEEAAANQKGIAVGPPAAGVVSGVKSGGYFGVHFAPRVDRAGEAKCSHLQRPQYVAACPVVFDLIVHQGKGENDILVLHPNAGIAVYGMKLAGEDGHDGTGPDRKFPGGGGHCAAPFFDIDDFHLVVPVEVHPGKILRDRAQISVVGKARLFMQQSLFILSILFQIHGKSFQNGDADSQISLSYYFMRKYCKKYVMQNHYNAYLI